MTAKNFLLNNDNRLNLTSIAKIMYPKNKTANEYLSRKLHGSRPWTAADEQKAITALKQLHVDIGEVIK